MRAVTVTCPTCHTPMQPRDRHGVRIDQCPACRGVWLDKGELDTILQRSTRFLEIPSTRERRTHPGHRREEFFDDRFEWF